MDYERLRVHIYAYRIFYVQWEGGYEYISELYRVRAECLYLTSLRFLQSLWTRIYLFPDCVLSKWWFFYGFHDPYNFLIFASLKLFKEYRIFTRKIICKRKIVIASSFLCLTFSLYCLFVSLNILRE